MATGGFRADLFYRLGVIQIEVPALRDRAEDILPLSRLLLGRIIERLGLSGRRLDPACMDFLTAYRWPGNVRELENVLERAAVLSTNGVIHPEDLPVHVVNAGLSGSGALPEKTPSLAEVAFRHIRNVLATSGSRQSAADTLGISQATLWRKLKQMEQAEGGAESKGTR